MSHLLAGQTQEGGTFVIALLSQSEKMNLHNNTKSKALKLQNTTTNII